MKGGLAVDTTVRLLTSCTVSREWVNGREVPGKIIARTYADVDVTKYRSVFKAIGKIIDEMCEQEDHHEELVQQDH